MIIALLIGALFGIYFFLSGATRSYRAILISMLYSLNIGSLMMLVIYKRNSFLIYISRRYLRILVIIVLLAFAAVAGTEITSVISSLVIFQTEYLPFKNSNLYFLNILIVLVTGLPIYEREEWKNKTISRLERQEFELLKLEQLRTASELEMLRAKINPHFLFNVHNSIANLIRTNPIMAEETLLLLSRFFRFTLGKKSSTWHPLSEELEIIHTYLDLQKVRFGDALEVQIDIEKDLQECNIPSFLLQPIVENIFKHSAELSSNKLKICITASKQGEFLTVEIYDSGVPFPENISYGFGFQSVIDKLNLLCPDQYHLKFYNEPYKKVEIKFSIYAK